MHYRHLYHAGNFADVFKHVLLVALLQVLSRKDKPWCYLDTHAGAGRYELDSSEADRTGEWRDGIGRLWNAAPKDPVLSLYLELIRSINPSAELPRRYPGSPWLAAQLARPEDRLIVCEQVPAVAQTLSEVLPTAELHRRDGYEAHQFLYVEDAALAFAGVLDKSHCIGQTYNMTKRGYVSWRDYHETAMKVIGREVELVGVPFASLEKCEIPNFSICADIFRFNSYFDSSKLFRHVPEFVPQISLETGIAQVLEALDADGRIPDSDEMAWEDAIIKKQLSVFRS